MRSPRTRFTVRSLMVLVAVVAALMSASFKGMPWGLAFKEEIRARRGVVARLANFIKQDQDAVENLTRRITRSSQQPEKDPRHDHWVRELVRRQESAAAIRRSLPQYQRLADYPWLPFPEKGLERDYLDEKEMAYLYRYDQRTLWSTASAAVPILIIMTAVVLLRVIARRRRSRRRDQPA